MIRRSEEELNKSKVVVIVRNVEKDNMEELFYALYEAGVKLVEITLNTSNALDSINDMSRIFKDKMIVGAGTVINLDLVKAAKEAGAGFIVTPNVNKEVISFAKQNELFILPGAMTPSEIITALSFGAEYIKLFPAASLGANYLKEIRGPLNNVKLVAVGGINNNNANSFLNAGACGVGIGGSIINLQHIKDKKFDIIYTKTKELLMNINHGVI